MVHGEDGVRDHVLLMPASHGWTEDAQLLMAGQRMLSFSWLDRGCSASHG